LAVKEGVMSERLGGIFWPFFVCMLFMVILFSSHVRVTRHTLQLHEGRIKHLERMLNGAIEQSNSQADELAVLETQVKWGSK
jgi:hypothetical protein